MKSTIAGTIAATALIIIVFGLESNAQSRTRIVAEVPFSFYVGNTQLPAGRYEFEQLNPQVYPGALIVRAIGESGHRSMTIPALPRNGDDRSASQGLTFNRYGTTHYLSAVDLTPESAGLRLRKGRHERQMALEFQAPSPINVPTAIVRSTGQDR